MPKIKLTDNIKRKIDELLQLEATQLQSRAIKKNYRSGWFRTRVAEDLKFDEEDGPSLRTYEVYLQKMRPKRELADPLDDPWTLSASIDHNIPPSSTQALLKAWRICQAIDHTLTIRQAKWIAYLSTVITSTPDLLSWAGEYAQSERSEKLLFGKFDSSDIDAAFTMTYAESGTASLLGKLMPVIGPYLGRETRPLQITDDPEDALFAARISEYRALNKIHIDPYQPSNNIPLRLHSYDDDLPRLQDLNFLPSQLWVHAHWLTGLSQGPEWQNMERKQIIEIITELRQWISKLPEFMSELADNTQSYMSHTNQTVKLEDLATFPIMPGDLIDKAGFNPSSEPSFPGHWQNMPHKP